MKITPRDYAVALYETTEGQDRSVAEQTVNKLVRVLQTNHHLGWAEKIITEYYKYFREQKHVAQIILTSHAPLSASLLGKVIQTFPDGVELEEKIDPTVEGGIILEINQNFLIDGSVRSKLKKLRDEINSI